MKKIEDKILMFIVWHLPPKIIMWAYVRVMALAWAETNKQPDEITYSDVFEVLERKFDL
jgi:hypothetical protein